MNIKELKSKIVNTLDISIVIVAASILVAAIFLMNNKQIQMLFDKADTSSVTVSINSTEVSADDFKIGEKVYFADTGETAGTVVSAKNIKEKRYSAINNSLLYDYTDKNIGVLLEFETKIKNNESKMYIFGSVFAAPGAKYTLYTDNAAPFECTIDDIVTY